MDPHSKGVSNMAIPKIFPAGGGERAQYLLHNFNDNTIRFVTNYPAPLEPEILCAATEAIVNSVEVLHSTFFSDGTLAYWHINEDVDSHNYFHCVEVNGDPAVTAESLSLLPIYPEDKVQFYVTLVQSGTASSVVIRISHLVVDGADAKYLLQKLTEAYNLILTTGSAENLTIKHGSRMPEQVYEKFGLKDMKGLYTGGVSTVPTAYPYPSTDVGLPRITKAIIPAIVMSAARKKAKLIGASANDLLVTACYHAYAALDSIDPHCAMSISSMMDLRRHMESGESKGLCNMSGALPTTLEGGVCNSFEETLSQVAVQTAKAKENPYAGLSGMPIMHGMVRSTPAWMMQMIISKIYGNPSIGLTNLGNMDCRTLTLGEIIPVSGLFGGPLKKKPGMQVSVMSFDGTCVLAVLGSHTKADAKAIQQMLDGMVKEVENYAAE